jgi:hypothetical protein
MSTELETLDPDLGKQELGLGLEKQEWDPKSAMVRIAETVQKELAAAAGTGAETLNRLQQRIAELEKDVASRSSVEQAMEQHLALNAKLTEAEQMNRDLRIKMKTMEEYQQEYEQKVNRGEVKLPPAIIGAAGERNVMKVLEEHLGEVFEIKNISRDNNGKGLDLQVCGEAGIDIRIDVKARKRPLGLKEQEKFMSDVDAISPAPTGAILYSQSSSVYSKQINSIVSPTEAKVCFEKRTPKGRRIFLIGCGHLPSLYGAIFLLANSGDDTPQDLEAKDRQIHLVLDHLLNLLRSYDSFIRSSFERERKFKSEIRYPYELAKGSVENANVSFPQLMNDSLTTTFRDLCPEYVPGQIKMPKQARRSEPGSTNILKKRFDKQKPITKLFQPKRRRGPSPILDGRPSNETSFSSFSSSSSSSSAPSAAIEKVPIEQQQQIKKSTMLPPQTQAKTQVQAQAKAKEKKLVDDRQVTAPIISTSTLDILAHLNAPDEISSQERPIETEANLQEIEEIDSEIPPSKRVKV